MTITRPPRLATWLLERLASGPQGEALAGDLVEQYQQRQSAAWYWWQVVTAIAAGAVHDLREHYMLALRAIATWYLLAWFAASVAETVYGWFGLSLWNWTVAHDWDTVRVIWFGRPRWGQPPLLLMSCLNPAIIGWIMARLNRGHVAATLLGSTAFSLFYLMVQLWSGRMLWPVAYGPWPIVPPVAYLVALIGAPVSFLVGGLLGSKRYSASGNNASS